MNWALGSASWRRLAEVTESYISQLLAKKKTPPAPDRTDIYDKVGKVLKLSSKCRLRMATFSSGA
jgi:hypothetical protein